MSTLGKFQQLRARSKTTKKYVLEISRNPAPNEKLTIQKKCKIPSKGISKMIEFCCAVSEQALADKRSINK